MDEDNDLADDAFSNNQISNQDAMNGMMNYFNVPSLTQNAEMNKESDNSEQLDDDSNIDSAEGAKQKAKKLSQNARQKKIISEKNHLISEQQRKIDEMALLVGQLNHRLDKMSLDYADQTENYLNLKKDDLRYTKKHYENQEQYDEANKSEEELANLHYELLKVRENKNIYKSRLNQNAELLTRASQEVKSKNYSIPDEDLNPADEEKLNSRAEFFRKHPYLNPEPNNPNYSQNLFDMSLQEAVALEDDYKINGRGEEIGTRQFYNDLSATIKSRLNQKGNPPMSNRNIYDNAAPQPSVYRNSNRAVRLTNDEIRMRDAIFQEFGISPDKNKDEYNKRLEEYNTHMANFKRKGNY